MQLIGLREAARMLGYTEKGLRKIVARSRARVAGARTHGPTIKFFQTAKGAAVRFRPEWIEEFINENTVDPSQPVETSGGHARKKRLSPTSALSQLDQQLLEV